jgi:hypothetical protein
MKKFVSGLLTAVLLATTLVVVQQIAHHRVKVLQHQQTAVTLLVLLQ